MPHYIDNKTLTASLGTWAASVRVAKASNTPPPPMPADVGEACLLIAQRVASKVNWRSYSYVEDMIADAVMACVRYGHNFDADRSNNAFAYISQVVHHSFIRSKQSEDDWTHRNMYICEQNEHLTRETRFQRDLNAEHAGFQRWVSEKALDRKRVTKLRTTDEKIEAVKKALTTTQLTLNRIAALTGVSESTVKTIRDRFGLSERKAVRMSVEDAEKVVERALVA